MDVMFKRKDGTFVIDKNGYPYHVIPSDPLFEEAAAAGINAPMEPMLEPVSVGTWRQTASISRKDFCVWLFRNGILSAAESVVAAKGDWPDTFAESLSSMSDDEKVEAQIDWATANNVLRSHHLLDALRVKANLSPEVLDAAFGWVDPE